MNPFDAKIRTIDWMDADKCVLSFDGFDSHHNSLQLAKNSVAIGESTGAAIWLSYSINADSVICIDDTTASLRLTARLKAKNQASSM